MNYDYHCGVIDAFNEVIKAEVKHMALSHPSTSQEIKKSIKKSKSYVVQELLREMT